MNTSIFAPFIGYIISFFVVASVAAYTLRATWQLRRHKLGLWWLMAGSSVMMLALLTNYSVKVAELVGLISPATTGDGVLAAIHVTQAGAALTMGLATLKVSHDISPAMVKRITRMFVLLLLVGLAAVLHQSAWAFSF